jgi:targeting protein for Xklp2
LFLYLQERGAEKERKFVMELMQKQIEEERARFHRANPYPYTTDYPVVIFNNMYLIIMHHKLLG